MRVCQIAEYVECAKMRICKIRYIGQNCTDCSVKHGTNTFKLLNKLFNIDAPNTTHVLEN